MGKYDGSFELMQQLAAEQERFDDLEKLRAKKQVELACTIKDCEESKNRVARIKGLLEEKYDYFIDVISRYERTIIRRIAEGDKALEGLKKVFIRQEESYSDTFTYRPVFRCMYDANEKYGECYFGDESEASHVRMSDCRLEALERAIVGEDGVLVKSEGNVDSDDAIRLFSFLYRSSRKKDIPTVLKQFKEIIEGRPWDKKEYDYYIDKYLFALYVAPKTAQRLAQETAEAPAEATTQKT